MPDTKQLVESVLSSANMEQIKKFAKPVIMLGIALAAVVGVVWMFMFFFSGGGADVETNRVESARLDEKLKVVMPTGPPRHDLVTCELGWFDVTNSIPNFQGEIRSIDVTILVTVQKKDAAKYHELESKREFAIRGDVESILRDSDSQEWSEKTLGTIRNKIKVKINERLGANYVQDVICSDVRIGSKQVVAPMGGGMGPM